MIRLLWISIAVGSLLSGCAGNEWKWSAADSFNRPLRADYPNAPAVVLARDIKYTAANPPKTQAYYHLERHELLSVLTEGGFKYAEVRIRLGPDDEIRYLKARTVSPAGVVQEVTPKEVFEDNHNVASLRFKTKLFRFPTVVVGSLVEYAYLVESPHALFWTSEQISSELPIVRYHLDFTTDEGIQSAFKVYHSGAHFVKSRHGEDITMTLDLANVPATSDEQLTAPKQATEPWWAYRVEWYQGPQLRQIAYATWPDTLKQLVDSLYVDTDKYFKNMPAFDSGHCGSDRRCAIEHAVAFVRDKTSLNAFRTSIADARPVKDVLASGVASNFEKALLLWAVLDAQHVTARFALVGRNPGLAFDLDFPLPQQFDHLMLYIDADKLFIDPTCEQCAVGQLSGWTAGREALVLLVQPKKTSAPDVEVLFTPVTGAEPLAGTQKRTFDLRLDANGAVSGNTTEDLDGLDAVDTQIKRRTWLPKDAREALEKDLKRRLPTTRLGSSISAHCERERAHCRIETGFTVPGYASADGALLAVPLSFLSSPWDNLFHSNHRDSDLFLSHGDDEEETIVVHLPAGYVVDELPESQSIKTPIADFAFAVTSAPGVVTVRRAVHSRAGSYDKSMYVGVSMAVRAFAASRRKVFTVKPGGETR